MGLRNYLGGGTAQAPPPSSGLRRFVGNPPAQAEPTPGLDIAAPSEIRATPQRSAFEQVQGAAQIFDEFQTGLLDNFAPFGAGRKLSAMKKLALPLELVDNTMDYKPTLDKTPQDVAKNIPVVGELTDMFNIPPHFTDDVKGRLFARKAGRLIGDFARFAVIDRLLAGVKAPKILQAAMGPAAQAYTKQALTGAFVGVTGDVPEHDLEHALIGMGIRGGVGAIAFPLFGKLMSVGGGIAEAAHRESQLLALREARAFAEDPTRKVSKSSLDTFLKVTARFRARRLAREAAVTAPEVAREAADIEAKIAATLPKTPEPKVQPVQEARSQASQFDDNKLRNEIVVLEMRAKDEPERRGTLLETAKQLRAEYNRRILEKARAAKAAKAQPKPKTTPQPPKVVEQTKPLKVEAPRRPNLKAKTAPSGFQKLADQGQGVVKELAGALQPGADQDARLNTFAKLRRILDRSNKPRVHIGILPAGGADPKSRVKWETFFPDELGLEFHRRGTLFDVYATKASADAFGPPSGVPSRRRIDPEKTLAQVAELERSIEEAIPGQGDNLAQYANKNNLSPEQYRDFLQNYLKKHAPSKAQTEISPAQAKQGFPEGETPPVEVTPKARLAGGTPSDEEDFFKSMGATKEPSKPAKPTAPPKPKKKRGPVMALKEKTTGKVYSDPEAATHADVLIKNNLDADNVERGVVQSGAYRPLDELPELKAYRDKLHDLGSEANGISILIQVKNKTNPTDPEIEPLKNKLDGLTDLMDTIKRAMVRESAKTSVEGGFVNIAGGTTRPSGTPRPTPQAPEGARPREFPDKGDFESPLFIDSPKLGPLLENLQVTFDLSGKTRGRLTLPEIEELSRKKELTISQLASLKPGTAGLGEDIMAAKRVLENGIKQLYTDVKISFQNPTDTEALANAIATTRQFLEAARSARGLIAEWGRAGRVLRIAGALREYTTPQAQAMLDNVDRNSFFDFAKNFTAAIERGDLNAAMRGVAPLARKGFFEKLVNFSNALYLTSPQTDIVNFTGNSLALLTTITEIPFIGATDFVLSKLKGTPRSRFAVEGVVELFSLMEGINDGAGDFWRVLIGTMEGETVDPIRLADGLGLGVTPGPPKDISDVVNNVIYARLAASDALFKAVKRRMSINGQAYRIALLENLSGEAFATRVHELRRNPTARMWQEATARALEATFQEALVPGGLLAKMNAARGNPHTGWILRIMLPFFRTPVDMLRFAARRSPLAFTPGALSQRQMFGGAAPFPMKDVLPSDLQMAQAEALGRTIIGSLLGALMTWLTLKGNLTGLGPTNFKKQELMRAQGWQPTAIKVGDRYVSYRRFEPLAYVMQPFATLAERFIGPAQHGQDVGFQEVHDAILSSAGFVLNSTFWRQIGELNEALAGKNKDFAANLLAGRVAIPGVQFVNRVFFDSVIRKPKGFIETLKSRIPGLSKQIAPAIDAAGNEIEVPNRGLVPFQVTKIVENPAIDELLRLNINIPSQGETFQKIRLQPIEVAEVQKLADKKIMQALNGFVASDDYERLSDEDRTSQIKSLIKGIREAAGWHFLIKKRSPQNA